MRILTTICFAVLFATAGLGQIKFFKLFTNNGADMGQGVVQLEDSSYVITGSSSSFQDGPSQAFLLKIDSAGNYKWSKHYGGSEIESGRRVLYKKNFGFFICGYTNSYGNGGFDMYIAKVAENADLEWEKTIGGTGWEQVHDASLTRDTGILMVGETSSNITDNKDIYIVRTDKNGDTLWTKTIGGSGDDYATCLARYQDSMFVVGGQVWVEDSLLSKAYMLYLKDDGTVFWEDTSGVNGNYWINGLVVDEPQNRFLAVGGTTAPTKDGIDSYFYWTDYGGTPLGYYEQNNPGDENFVGLTPYGSNGDFYMMAHTEDAGSFEGGTDLLIHKFNSGLWWASGFGVAHIGPDVGGQIIPTSDGSAVAVGYTTGVVSGGNEAFVLKIGPNDSYPDPGTDVIVDDILIVSEAGQPESFSVYPNPASTQLMIHSEDNSWTEALLYDVSGKVLAKQELQFENSIDVSMLPTGWYLLEVRGENGKAVRNKVMVQR